MVSQSSAAGSRGSHTRSIAYVLLSSLLVALVALLPRVLNLGIWVSGDESLWWFTRSDIFLKALRSGNFVATAQAPHPGVTTMWLGSAGILLRQALFNSGLVTSESFPTILTMFRLPAAIVHTVGVLIGFWLLRRLVSPRIALVAALLWATDPFVIAFSRVLHVDALAATFSTLCLLAACCYWHHRGGIGFLFLSAICGALAILSKWPALAVTPIIAAIALVTSTRNPHPRWWLRFQPLLIWGVICAVASFLIWPVFWSSPVEAYRALHFAVFGLGDEPHELGNFFLGRLDPAPGLLFYPLAFIMRLTPWAMVGLILLPLAWRWDRRLAVSRRDLLILLGYSVAFMIAMSIFPKKFNRYLIPIFPAVDIMAAAGLVWGTTAVGNAVQRLRWPTQFNLGRFIGPGLLVAITLVATLNAGNWYKYGIAYFNPVFGGAKMGAHLFLVGWGEGLDQAAAWLNQQPDITSVTVESNLLAPLQFYLKPGAQAIQTPVLPPNAGYVVVYVRWIQGSDPPRPFDQFWRHATPLHVVQIHGVDYAWIYQVPPPVDEPRSVDFADSIHLRGVTQTSTFERGQPFSLKLAWEPRTRPSADNMLFAHLIGPDGVRYAQIDLPIPTASWYPGRYESTDLPLSISPDAPPGRYQLMIGLYDPQTGERLPISNAKSADPAIDGPNALTLMELELK